MRTFWDVALYILVVVDRRFRSAYCLRHDPDKTSVYSENTRHYIPEGFHIRNRRLENLKYHI
jgi:hypothetical protein